MPFAQQVKTLAKAKGLSISKLGWKAHQPDQKGTSQDTLNKALQGKRPLNDPIVEAVATALGVPPETFVEYRLSQLRQALDYRVVGFEQAAALLERIEASATKPGAQDFAQVIVEVLERSRSPSTSTGAKRQRPRRPS